MKIVFTLLFVSTLASASFLIGPRSFSGEHNSGNGRCSFKRAETNARNKAKSVGYNNCKKTSQVKIKKTYSWACVVTISCEK